MSGPPAHGHALPPLPALCLGLALAACGGDTADGASAVAFEVRDSAGVQVVTNGSEGAMGAGRLALVEDLRIGMRDGPEPYQLYSVWDVVQGPDGAFYVSLRTPGEIRVFEADGTHRATWGGQGEGPGEFRGLTTLLPVGDTLLAFDSQLRRLSALDGQGNYLASWPLQRGLSVASVRGRAPEGWLVGVSDFSVRQEYGIGRPVQDTARIALATSLDEAAAALESADMPWDVLPVVLGIPGITVSGVGTASGAIFGRPPLWEGGQSHVVDAAGRIHVARGEQYAIDTYDAHGTHLRRLSRRHDPVPVTAALKDRYRDAIMAHYDTANTTGEAGLDLVDAARQHIAMDGPTYVAALGAIVASAEGGLWVERPALVEDPLRLVWSPQGPPLEHWDIFDPEGRFQGTVRFPRPITVHVVGPDWVVVTERDEFDVQYIVRYRVEAGGGG